MERGQRKSRYVSVRPKYVSKLYILVHEYTNQAMQNSQVNAVVIVSDYNKYGTFQCMRTIHIVHVYCSIPMVSQLVNSKHVIDTHAESHAQVFPQEYLVYTDQNSLLSVLHSVYHKLAQFC